MHDAPATEHVDISVPAGMRYVRVLRLVTAGVLSLRTFDVDFVEDVRAAVGEAAALVLGDHGARGQLRLTIDCDDDSVSVRIAGEFAFDPVRDTVDDDLAELLLTPLVDDYELVLGSHLVTFAKQRDGSRTSSGEAHG